MERTYDPPLASRKLKVGWTRAGIGACPTVELVERACSEVRVISLYRSFYSAHQYSSQPYLSIH